MLMRNYDVNSPSLFTLRKIKLITGYVRLLGANVNMH